MHDRSKNIGAFIREKVFPSGLTVTAAAEILNIGRVALSRVLNGKASLSPGLAERIETAFGFPAAELLQMQISYRAETAKHENVSVPPFLQVRASQIETWAARIGARSQLSVLLRALVNSTGSGLTKVDFPGNDDAERKGWDGFVEARQARPWVPEGTSGWEFGCGKEVKRKADGDFGKRTRDFSSEERKDITFVFVTPRRWPGKNDWGKKRRDEGQWKDVRVFDSSDLEQWMEQSIPAQTWFANETGIPSEGAFSLEACWKKWGADCEPALVPALFDQALVEYKRHVLRWLEEEPGRPLSISADSVEEGLAFLHVVFSGDEVALRENADKVVVFKKPKAVSKLVSAAADMIAVSTSSEVEHELAPNRKSVRTVLVYTKNAPGVKPDIELKSLNPFAFAAALKKMGCGPDKIGRLGRESGFSLTVLRRRLSMLPAVRAPGWAGNKECASSLVAATLAGTWDTANPADKFLVSELAGGDSYEDIERKLLDLRPLDDTPFWSAGTHLGVKSKVDALFAVSDYVTEPDVDRFFEVAKLVITEDNPALDLPDDERWMANLYGKSREISDMLRRSVIDSFLLLAVHGSGLFRERGGFGIEARVRKMVKKWFRPGDARSLESRKDALPAFAEAAPETFLSIIEKDLENDEPGILSLFRTVEAPALMSPSPPRVELLWALESLAWSGEYLQRVATILAKFAEKERGDNWSNSSMKSLRTIFQSRAPQTSAPLDGRIPVFNGLLDDFPDIGWILCLDQFVAGAWCGEFGHRPRWRTDGHGHGWGAWDHEREEFDRNAVEKAIRWPFHKEETLADLVANFENIPIDLQPQVWRRIKDWRVRENPADEDKARLREAIRVSGCFYLALEEMTARAREEYDMLEPSDIVIRHEWLFLGSFVKLAKWEVETSGLEFNEYMLKSEKETEEWRMKALSDIYSQRGVDGLIDLARRGEGQAVVGRLALGIPCFDESEVKTLIRSALTEAAGDNRHRMENLIRGVLEGFEETRRENVLREFLETGVGVKVLSLAPFRRETWELLNKLSEKKRSRYWEEVDPSREPDDLLELGEAVENLIRAKRPFRAARLADHRIVGLEPKSVFRLLEAIGESRNEEGSDYVPDSWFVEKAFERLDEGGIPTDRMVSLEVAFMDSLRWSERGVLNLEKHIERHPGLFVELVDLAYKRDDEKEAVPEGRAGDEARQNRVKTAHGALEALKRTPGLSESGEIDKDRLIKWVGDARDGCGRSGRLVIGDYRIGVLLSKSPDGKDGIWPAEPVRDALEKFYSEEISQGFQTGRRNARGARVGFGGDPEREIESEYREWEKKIRYSHPRTSQILLELADSYSEDAGRQDDFAKAVYRRLSF